MDHLEQQKRSNKSSDGRLPIERIRDDQIDAMDEGRLSRLYASHSLVVHHTKRAHVYKVCCEPTETFDTFTEKLATFYPDSNEKDDVQAVLHEWFVAVVSRSLHFIHNTHCSVRRKAPPNRYGIPQENKCSAAYKDLENATLEREL